jgi:pimeloyl-ACP methyl ester carboxylesterase
MTEIRPGRKLHLAVSPGTTHADTTVFLCHGAGGSKNQWRPQWKALVEAGYTVVAWDYPGHGEGIRSRRREDYAGEAFAADYLALFETYKGARNVLVGHSYGSRLTLAVLQRLQGQGRLGEVQAAALLGAPPPIATLGLGPIATWPLWLLILMRPSLKSGFRKAAWSARTDEALIRWEDNRTDRNTLFMMKSLMTQSQVLAVDKLADLALPVLLIAGADDGVTPPAASEAMAGALPDAVLQVYADCGHQIMLEQPELTTQALLDLIATGARNKDL